MSKAGKSFVLSLVLIVLFAGIGIGIFQFRRNQEERRHYAEFESFLSLEADAAYNSLPLSERLATGRLMLPVLRRLQKTDWEILATGLQPALEGEDTDASEFIFKLGLGDSALLDCVVSEPDLELAGSCHSFTHTLPREFSDGSEDGKLPTRSQNAPLDLHLGEAKYASSQGKARISLGVDSDFQVEGQVMVDSQDVRVTDAALLIPNPLRPESELTPVSIGEFSPRSTLEIQTVSYSGFNVTYDMPTALAPFFANQEKLTVLGAQAAVRVDLLQTGYHLEGTLVVLNHLVGRGVIEYYPGQHASLYLSDLSIPTALPSVCFEIKSALLELDFSESRLRLAGTTEVETVDSFLCKEGGMARDMGFLTHLALSLSLNTARSFLSLPETLVTSGHLVVDVDDSILCADMAVNGHSLLHAAYLGNAQTFQMWAPKGFATPDVSSDRLLGSAWDLIADSWSAEWEFPEATPLRCWNGDTGPRTDMSGALLSSESEDYVTMNEL